MFMIVPGTPEAIALVLQIRKWGKKKLMRDSQGQIGGVEKGGVAGFRSKSLCVGKEVPVWGSAFCDPGAFPFQ